MVDPDYWLIKVPERSYWTGDEILNNTEAINGVYAFNRNLHVHICSFNPTYEMHFMGTDYEEVDGLSDDARESLNCLITDNDSSEPVTYMSTSTVEKLLKANPDSGYKVTEYLDDEEDAIEQIHEGWATGSFMY
ncbi:MAG: hypothetical protein DRI24_17015 [Deltaproteobacteria bacterium]|nr:MAG: hypothetical protein DRI24_17015 [Deltaproteobacteria bacterium]